MITLYTDGAAKGNPGPGGYGGILMYQAQKKEYSGAYACTTNNRMELLAVIIGLELLQKPHQKVVVYSDSRYVVDAVQKGWLKTWQKTNFKKRKNSDLWRRFLKLIQQHHVTFIWIKGHANNPYNERCDQLAVEASTKGPWLVDTGYMFALHHNIQNYNEPPIIKKDYE